MKRHTNILFGAVLTLFCQIVLAIGNPVTVPFSNPTFIPSNTSATASLSTTGVFGPYQVYGNDANARINVSGVFQGLVATVYVTSDSGQATQSSQLSNYNWVQAPVTTNQGQFANTITTPGMYSVNVSGASAFYVNVTSLSTGTVNASVSEGLDDYFDATFMVTRQTYHADFGGLALTSTTDYFGICGSATRTVSISHIEFNATNSSASASKYVRIVLRSTVDTGGTPSNVVGIASDLNDTNQFTLSTSSPLITGNTYTIMTLGTTTWTSLGATATSIGSLVNGTNYIITALGTTNFSAIGAGSSPAVGQTFTYNGVTVTGSGGTVLTSNFVYNGATITSGIVNTAGTFYGSLPTATVTTYTGTGPTVGTSVGNIRSGVLNAPVAAALGVPPLSWDFGAQSRNFAKEVTLRGANQCLYITGGGSFANSTGYGAIEWTEY